MKLSKKQREQLKQKFGGRCAYCGCELGAKFHADHIEAVLRNIGKDYAMDRPENDTIGNLFPSCAPCNLYKMSDSLEGFRKRIATQVEVTRRASRSYRTAEAFGLVSATGNPVMFWFERYQTKTEAA